MSEAWRVASIITFEQVPVGAGALLRVAATSTVAARPGDGRPTLVADDGYDVAYFDALPAPPDAGGELRCAFSVPAELAAGDTVFSLELIDGNVIALAPPAGSESRGEEWSAPGSDPADPYASDQYGTYDDEYAEDEGSLMLGLLLDAAEARAELRAMHDLRAVSSGATRRRRVDRAEPAHDDDTGQLGELRVWSDELERRLAQTTTALDEARAELLRHGIVVDGEPGDGLDGQLSQVGAAALDEAQRRAERDLADVGP